MGLSPDSGLTSAGRRVRCGDVELHLAEAGAGPPLLFVHGFPLSGRMWRGQLAGLADAARLLVPDLRGFGLSDVTPGAVTMERQADDLAALLDALRIQEPVTLCGLSMGGYVAWQFWRRWPHKLARLILCDTRAAADAPEAARARRLNAERVTREGASVLVETMLERLVSPVTRRDRPELLAELEAEVRRCPPVGAAAALRGMAERPDATEWLREIDAPALVVCGADDLISPPAEMQALAAALPRGRYVEIPRAGHLAPLEAPEAVNAAIRAWLAET